MFEVFVRNLEETEGEKVFRGSVNLPPTEPTHTKMMRLMEKFEMQGTVIVYYMLKCLWEEQLLGNPLTTIVPPDLYYSTDTLLIYSDIVEAEVVNEANMAILRQLKLPQHDENRNVQTDFNPVQYKKCIRTETLSNLRIYISSITGDLVNFLRGPIFVVLHFVQEALK